MNEEKWPITCSRHGPSYAAFVCKHLVRGEHLGFVTPDEVDDSQPIAWCNDCDRVLLEEGDWNDRSEGIAGLTAICANCYNEIRRCNIIWDEDQDRKWLLENALDKSLQHPNIFHLPPLELSQGLQVGGHAKLIFLLPGEDENGPYYQGERMWVTIEKVDDVGYWGVLESHPVTKGSIEAGDKVLFGPEHIIDIDIQGR